MGNKQSTPTETENPIIAAMEAQWQAEWQASFREQQDERFDAQCFQKQAAKRCQILQLRRDFSDFFEESDEYLRE